MPQFAARPPFTVRAGDWTLALGEKTLVMGILNVTPDSFSDKGRYFGVEASVRRAWEIAEEGAGILDIGGESTRPGSQGVGVEEEVARVIPTLEALAKGPGKYPLPISVDTVKSEVARAALDCGAAIINDISGMAMDPGIGPVAAEHGAALVLMHMRGTPQTMQTLPPSPDILGEIDAWAEDAVARARACGVSDDRLILDPGVGFGKTAAQNVEIIANIPRLAKAGFPILMGTSRKAFIGALTRKPPRERVFGTCATVAASILCGAHIVRVHDVAAAREVADVTDAIARAGGGL
ncbi:MAG: dihydropteroate synthase [Acidobacteriota bacterium]|jgi:dihydropteroate synthase|nr:dihydropteroate synthase [Acidobacteriota bacterium]